MERDRKTYTVSLDDDVHNTYIMALTKEQVEVFNWLRAQGYDLTIIEQGDVVVL